MHAHNPHVGSAHNTWLHVDKLSDTCPHNLQCGLAPMVCRCVHVFVCVRVFIHIYMHMYEWVCGHCVKLRVCK